MTAARRSLLLTALVYFAALCAVAGLLHIGLSALGPAVQAHFLHGGERQQTRLDPEARSAFVMFEPAGGGGATLIEDRHRPR